jgi:transcriptional adapter 3
MAEQKYRYVNTPGLLDTQNEILAREAANWAADLSSIPRRASRAIPSPTRANPVPASGSSSSLSPASQLQSPIIAKTEPGESGPATPTLTVDSDDSHQPPPAANVQSHLTFGLDPLHFDDPTIYHVREVHPDMTDEEKTEIYCVSAFPHDDLSSLVAGVPPDKDFSNAKPSNQVNANTFATYLEPYLRPLQDEDMSWLKERVPFRNLRQMHQS